MDTFPFYVGQTVKDHLGRKATVFKVERTGGDTSFVLGIRHENGMQVHYVGSTASILKEIQPIYDQDPN